MATPVLWTGTTRPLLASHFVISDVSISKPFFSPALKQDVEIRFALAEPGTLSVEIVDREGYLVRKLVRPKETAAGRPAYTWDGRDDQKRIVPDEAYALRIRWKSGSREEIYAPSVRKVVRVEVPAPSYNRSGGVISYKLPKPARVQILASWQARGDGLRPGAARTLMVVFSEPKPAGAVVDVWNGFERGGGVYLPDEPGFQLVASGTALPENAIITVSNRDLTYAAYAAARKGRPLPEIARAGGRP